MRSLGVGLAYGLLGTGVALAADVTFSGTVLAACSLAVTTPGTLGLSADGTVLGSEEGLGTAALLTVVSTGDHTMAIEAPTRQSAPAGYDGSGEAIEVAYSGLSGLAAVSQAYTASPTSFAVGSIALSTLVINNRIVNPDGFAAGSYATRTVVTCS